MNLASLEIFQSIVEDSSFLINQNAFPILQLEGEKDPVDQEFHWKSLHKLNPKETLRIELEKHKITRDNINLQCQLCPGKISGIRHFLYRGRKPVLILHYSGAIQPKEKPNIKKDPTQIFKDKSIEKIWGDLVLKAYQFSHLEFFYQEFPACQFPNSSNNEIAWNQRIISCLVHVKETIKENNIRWIFILGNSARLMYGEKAKDLLGKVNDFPIPGLKIPSMVLRSPEALIALEDKGKTLFSYAQERIQLESSFIEQFQVAKAYF